MLFFCSLLVGLVGFCGFIAWFVFFFIVRLVWAFCSSGVVFLLGRVNAYVLDFEFFLVLLVVFNSVSGDLAVNCTLKVYI